MSDLRLPPIQPYHPTTFQERGVLVPFTTPLLGGTRARPSEKFGLDLVIPNPSGGPGVYILSWTSIDALCRPTIHDRQLSERIATIPSVAPSTIRRVAREVAAEGLAGEEARLAALNASDTDKNDRTVTNFLLLMQLIQQVGLFRDAGPSDPDMETRARLTVARIAPRVGRSPDWIATALEALGDVFAPIGVAGQPTQSRVPRLIAMLRRTCADLTIWSRLQQQADHVGYVDMICAVAEHTLAIAETGIAQTQAMTANLPDLLMKWARDPDTIIRLAARPEWLLDGWDQICHIWDEAKDDAACRAALIEIALLVPVLPREARDWADLELEGDPKARLRRTIPLNEDWRTGGKVFELIARNERILAATC